ncbi:MAG: anaerobic ribonucleoside-triphosphate reductase activating protein [Candidatus Margulisbacteria bacterium]|nr:anaerobic ribonucleoside-triphosphate reductase activating protein [Candidatus Margulisiibacteriota bacterium]
MNIRGFLETSFLDWDGKVSSVVFVPGCNFACPFCSNWLLVHEADSLPEVSLEKIDNFLRQRQDFIDGVVITGGEPTIHPDLIDLVKHFKAMGLLVKLDTNGTNPAVLSKLLAPDSKLIDYIAMDIKAPLNEKYALAAGTKVDLAKIRESIQLIMSSGVDYEFRTTVIPNILGQTEIEEIAKTIAGAKKYALQQFVPNHSLVKAMQALDPHPKETLLSFVEIAKKHVPATIARGV